ncbi:LPXTG cell wall anchor domain-containing protein [Microbacterium timonense]|uniref:LPXTG cell wall anchor domain-containing protein n=1 Tax=Microbacterium timonense TaxID=2086576 RepID=UPI000D0F4EE5|nr:LPXTG cell wall anchor domain-containing protein [Microbacterium timonense]
MKRSFFVALTVAGVVALGAPAAAQAETDDYTPTNPATPSLAGSTAVGVCEDDVPWISYDVTLIDPDAQTSNAAARLVLTDGTNSATIPLGTLSNGHLAGRVLWPGASVSASGQPTGWPGWVYENGAWVETSGNFRWTRGDISATIEVNPSLAVPLSYPPSTPECATDPGNPSTAAILPATGMGAAVLPIAIAGGVAVAIGAVIMLRRRAVRR